jgi:hypothetical protein
VCNLIAILRALREVYVDCLWKLRILKETVDIKLQGDTIIHSDNIYVTKQRIERYDWGKRLIIIWSVNLEKSLSNKLCLEFVDGSVGNKLNL